jgi:hypothetical protein
MNTLSNVALGPFELPSGKVITFRTLSFKERRELLSKWQKNDGRTQGYLLEEYFMAAALVTEDNQGVIDEYQSSDGYIARLDHWSMKDTSYYMEAFIIINGVGERERPNIEAEVKKILGVTPGTPLPPPPPVSQESTSSLPKGLKIM